MEEDRPGINGELFKLELNINDFKYWVNWKDVQLEYLWQKSRMGTKEDLERYDAFLKEYKIGS